MKRLLTVLGLAMFPALVRADYANTWSCDFGDNYASQVAENFELATQATTAQVTGTEGAKNGAPFLLLSDSASSSVKGGITSTFNLPDEIVLAGGDWQVEFDYAPSYCNNDNDATKYGLAFYGVGGTLLFNLDGQKKNGGINVLDGAGTTLGTIAVSSLTGYNTAADKANWLHVTVVGSTENNNVTLAIKTLADNEDVTLSSSIVSSSFVSPYSLAIKTANYSNRHQWAGFDDFVCGYNENLASAVTSWESGTVTSAIKFGAALTTDAAVNIEGGTAAAPILFWSSAPSAAYGLTQTAAAGWTIKESHALRIINGTYGVNNNIQLGTSGDSAADRSSGYLTINSGNVTMEGGLVVHGGTATIDGGSVVQNGTMSVGAKARSTDAVVNINGGSVTASAVKMGQYNNSSTLNLNGGSLTTGSFSVNYSTYSGTVNINGGTLIAAGDNTAFIPASGITVNVGASGGTLNLDGHAVTAKAAISGAGTLRVTGGGTLTLEAVPSAALNIVDSTVVVPYCTAFTADVATSGTGTIAVDCTGHQIGDTILTSAVSLAGVSVTISGLANVQANLVEGGQGFVIAEKEEEPVVQEIVPMFITGGQSNTDGRLDGNSLPEELALNERALVSYHAPLAVGRLGQFAAYAPCSGGEGQPGNWAYDAELYYLLGNALGKTFYVAKTSYGGTSIRPNVSNSPSTHPNNWLAGYGGGYHWSADEDFLAATVSAGRTFEKDNKTYDGQSLLTAWIENIDAAIDALMAANKTPDVKAIIWHQGESDKNNGLYAEDLTAVVTYVREHLATKLSDDKYLTLPFFCGNIPRKSSLFTVNLDKNFATIEETADNNMHVVDIYDLTMKSDNKHFDAASTVVFGKRLFNRMIDEGVIEAEKVEVADCVREPDFGTEHVINNTTTWTWENKSGDIATSLTNIDGIYFHAASSNSRKVQIYDTKNDKTLNWTIGDDTATVVSKGAYCTAYENNSSAISTTSTAGENNKANYMVAMNAGRSGEFEVFYWAREACTAKLYLNGTEVDSKDASAGEVVRLKGINTVKSVYYLALGKGAIMGARFVPDEEMPAVTLDIDETGWGTFGNLYEANFALPEGVTAYAINAVDGQPTLLSMTGVGALNLGDAVVVKGAPGSYTLTSAEGAKYDSENLMVAQNTTGILEATSGSDFINFMQTSENGELTFTKSDGTQTLAAGKAFFSITEGDAHSEQSTLICRNTGDTTKFTWTGNGEDTLWTTLENWAWPDGKAPLNAPGAGATVSFDEAAAVTFAANTPSGIKIVVNADVSFASDDGTTERIVIPSSITGTGRLTLKNKIRLQTVTYGSFSVDCTVEIEDGAAATLYTSGKNAKITINGALTGVGSLTAQNRNAYGSIVLSGDMSGYTGLLTTAPGDGTITISGDTGGSGIAINADDAEAAAAKVGPTRPADAKSAVTEEAYAAYYTKTSVAKEGADGYFVVTVALDETAVAADTTLATMDFKELINPERDTLTLTNAKPGLYYSIVGGTDVNALNIEGEKALATSTSVSPAKPDFGDDESSVHFFRMRVSSR